MPSAEAIALLKIEGVSKSYPGVKALDNVTLQINRGEVHALVGENGAGKSTLARIIAGLEFPDSGKMAFNNDNYAPANKNSAEKQGVRMVMQELNLIPTLSVAENIFLNRLPGSFGFIDRKQLASQSLKLTEKVGLKGLDPFALVSSLGVGQQQMVEIAAGLSENCKLLILDEPSAALTESETELLFNQVNQLKSAGVAIIYISHRMEELKQISQRITVLRDGVVRATLNTSEAEMDDIVRLMVGRDLDDIHPPESQKKASPGLRVSNLGRGAVVRNVSFEVNQGEILGFAGMMGSGRTELMRLIFGADQRDSGDIYIHGAKSPANIQSPKDAVRGGMAFLTEDRKTQGLLIPLSVSINTSLANLESVSKFGWINQTEEQSASDEYVAQLSTKCHSSDQAVKTLSGGNQQKVVLAKWIQRNSEIIIFDEPTRGIDIGAKFEIYKLLMDLAGQGRTIIVVSSDMLELFAISDRIAVMSNGHLADIFRRGDWSQAKIMAAALSKYASGKQPDQGGLSS